MGKSKASNLSSLKNEDKTRQTHENDSDNSENEDELEEQSDSELNDEQTVNKTAVKLLDYGMEEADHEDEKEMNEDIEDDEDEDNPKPSLKDIIESSKNNSQQDGSVPKKKKPGVIYLGNLPPGMKPNFVKSLISVHGNIKRQYLEPEDDAKRKRRVALGGSGGLRYVEGWIEFETKKEAKEIALLLNGTRIGRKKGSRFYDDFWMVKYLKGFTWEMLVEKSIIQRKERENRLRLELAKAKKEDEAFLHSVVQSKRIKANEAKQQKQQLKDKSSTKATTSTNNNSTEGTTKKRSLPRQLAPIGNKSARARVESNEEED